MTGTISIPSMLGMVGETFNFGLRLIQKRPNCENDHANTYIINNNILIG